MSVEKDIEYFKVVQDIAIKLLDYQISRGIHFSSEFKFDSHSYLKLTSSEKMISLRWSYQNDVEQIFNLSRANEGLSLYTPHSWNVNYINEEYKNRFSFVNTQDDTNTELVEAEEYIDSFFTNGLCSEDDHFQLSLLHPELPEYSDIQKAYDEVLMVDCPELKGYMLFVGMGLNMRTVRKIRRMIIHRYSLYND
ncbi:hypothetical protein BZF66_06145 [Salmonella enterica]|nr:hypothetical protein CPT_Munch_077 [Salmonella phage Munch]EAZ2022875.1 hypothetical protein [Salmonella enterica]ECV9084009.1 hypothetical protein [Salmonella enterica subsp. enterica serovar Infantis]EME3783044.1 hypothetical protein [Salmonella enterica]MCP0435891.1 hypothetical protein [Salmonella enterica subsp. enterica serovar Mbandaka]